MKPPLITYLEARTYIATGSHERTVPDSHGGADIYDGMMQLKGSLTSNSHGGHDLSQHGNAVASSFPDGHGVFLWCWRF